MQIFRSDETVALVLQDESMAPVMQSWLNDKEVTRYLGAGHWPMTNKAEAAYLSQRYENQAELTLGIFHIPSEKLVGSTGLHPIDYINQKAELGIMIGEKEYWDQGIGKQAITLLCEHGFGRLNLRHIYLRVLGHNPRGQKCYESCGFTEIGRFPKFIYKDGVWHDEVFMLKVRS